MTRPLLIAAAFLGTLAVVPACAMSGGKPVKPSDLAGLGFTLGVGTVWDDGLVSVRITGDPAKVKPRYAVLVIRGEAGTIAQCRVVGMRDGKLNIYRFEITPENLRHSYFYVTGLRPNEIASLGGGTSYEFHLADFIDATKLGSQDKKLTGKVP